MGEWVNGWIGPIEGRDESGDDWEVGKLTQGNFPTCMFSCRLLGCGAHQAMQSHDRRLQHPDRRSSGDGSAKLMDPNDRGPLHPDLPTPGHGRARPERRQRPAAVPPHIFVPPAAASGYDGPSAMASRPRGDGKRECALDHRSLKSDVRCPKSEVRCPKTDVRFPLTPDRKRAPSLEPRASSPDYDHEYDYDNDYDYEHEGNK